MLSAQIVENEKIQPRNEELDRLIESIHNAPLETREQIGIILKKECYIKQLTKIFVEKGIDECLIEPFYKIITGSKKVTVRNLDLFIHHLGETGILCREKIFKEQNLKHCFIDSIPENIKSYLESVLETLVVWKGKEGTKADVGDGERAIKLLTKECISESNTLEIKAMACRLNGTSEGFTTTTSARKEFLEYLNSILPEDKKISIKKGDDWNNLNFTNKGIKYFISLNLTNDQLADVLVKGISLVYNKIDTQDLKKNLVKDCFNQEGMDEEKFKLFFVKVQFDYYQGLKGFEGILFINSKNHNIKYIVDGESFSKAIDSKEIIRSVSWSWKQDRNSTDQYTLK